MTIGCNYCRAIARRIWDGLKQPPISIFASRLVLEPALKVPFDTKRPVYDSCYRALVLRFTINAQVPRVREPMERRKNSKSI